MAAPALDFSAVQQQLESHKIITDAAELHGLITGALAGGLDMNTTRWRGLLADMMNDGVALPGTLEPTLKSLYDQTCQQLIDSQYGFVPLIPADEEQTEVRAQTLANWTQGFLAGFGVIRQDLKNASDEARELLEDLSQIANLALPDGDERDEEALTEVYEYVRVAAMVLFAEFGQHPSRDETPKTLH